MAWMDQIDRKRNGPGRTEARLKAAMTEAEMERERELQKTDKNHERNPAIRGWAGWLLARVRATRRHEPRLQLLERISLAPRQSLALVEAEGRLLLVATSVDGGSAFYPLDSRRAGVGRDAGRENSRHASRVSW
jgi:Flagellar biosynthesis protein, FliO